MSLTSRSETPATDSARPNLSRDVALEFRKSEADIPDTVVLLLENDWVDGVALYDEEFKKVTDAGEAGKPAEEIAETRAEHRQVAEAKRYIRGFNDGLNDNEPAFEYADVVTPANVYAEGFDEGKEQRDIISGVQARLAVRYSAASADDVKGAFESLGYMFQYDLSRGLPVVSGMDGLADKSTWNATHRSVMMMAVAKATHGSLSRDRFTDIAQDEAWVNRFHPVRDMLDALPEWDGEERIGHIMTNGWKFEYDDDDPLQGIHADFIEHALVGAVRRAYTPGAIHDQVLTFVGARGGEGKTSFFRILGGEFHHELTQIPRDNQKMIEAVRGSWLIEFSELAGMTRQDYDYIKAMISAPKDSAAMKYDPNTTEQARDFVLVGTTNNAAMIRERGGFRRWNIIDITGKQLNTKWLTKERSQILAQAKYQVNPDNEHRDYKHLTFVDRNDPDDFAKIEAAMGSHVYTPAEADVIADLVDGRDFVATSELTEVFRNIQPYRIADVMTNLGYQRKARTVDGKKRRGFAKS